MRLIGGFLFFVFFISLRSYFASSDRPSFFQAFFVHTLLQSLLQQQLLQCSLLSWGRLSSWTIQRELSYNDYLLFYFSLKDMLMQVGAKWSGCHGALCSGFVLACWSIRIVSSSVSSLWEPKTTLSSTSLFGSDLFPAPIFSKTRPVFSFPHIGAPSAPPSILGVLKSLKHDLVMSVWP